MYLDWMVIGEDDSFFRRMDKTNSVYLNRGGCLMVNKEVVFFFYIVDHLTVSDVYMYI